MNLQRFIDAQNGVFDQVLEELRSGRKRTHWMWFVFPQLAGLGASAMSARFAISGLEEARAYVEHPTLGRRYAEVVGLVVESVERGIPIETTFGIPDDLKLRSSLTLFALVSPSVKAAMERLKLEPDGKTLSLLGEPNIR